MRAILKGLLSLARACLGLKAESEVPAPEPVARNVPLLTGPAPVHQGAVDAFGRSKVTRLNVKSGLPRGCRADARQLPSIRLASSSLTPAQREDVRALTCDPAIRSATSSSRFACTASSSVKIS